jgi:NAD(P)-dependent dehydrogenase (short-subunit alcohol dehydrogenase family)
MTTTARVALVTGASAGLGRACADRLAAAGWAVTGASRRGTAGQADTGWTGLVMDVDDDASVLSGVAGLQRQRPVDALVAAAGWGVAGAAEDTSIAEAKAQFETNFWGCVRVVQAVLPQMRARRSGRIVLLSSIGGVIGIPFQAYYSASKFALEGFAEALAYEVSPFGISVTLVQPGNFATDFTASRKMAAASAQSDYAAATAKAVAAMERDERNGAPPADVAAVVQRVLEARRPPRRVSVGKYGERAGLMAKRLLPFRIFEAAAKGSLGVD